MTRKRIAMLIMVDGAVLDEKYFEYTNQQNEEWNVKDESTVDQAQWFFY